MVVTYYEPHVSGLTIYVERISEELARRGHQVTVMTSQHKPDLPRHDEIRGVRVERLPILFRVSKGVVPYTLPLDAYRIAKEHDVVHMHLPLVGSPYVAAIARLGRRRRSIITYHCDVLLPKSLASGLITATMDGLHWLAAVQADALVTYTRDYAIHSRFLTRFPGKVYTVYPPIVIDPPDRGAAMAWRKELGLEGARIVGFAGRFSEDKGGTYLLQSITHLIKRVPDVHLVFAGEYKRVIGENYFEKVRPLVEANRDRLTFLGELHGQQLSNFYSMCDVLTLPSVNSTESFGMVQVEAMLCGTPVVASDIPGVRQSTKITGMGLTVPPRDSVALAEGLAEVLQNQDEYTRPIVDIETAFGLGRNVDFYERLYAGEHPEPAF